MIQQIDKDGNVIREWNCSVSDIAREIGCNRSVLQLALSGKRPYCKGYKWKSATDVATDDATPPIEDATTDILDATDATTEIRSLPPKRMKEPTLDDIDEDDPNEPQWESFPYWSADKAKFKSKERDYLEWTWSQIEKIPIKERGKREKEKGYPFFPLDKEAFYWCLSTHFKTGHNYGHEPASTIKRACELELFDCYLDKELWQFKQKFNKSKES